MKPWVWLVVAIAVAISGCGGEKKAPAKELGSIDNPVKMYFVPSMEAGKIMTSGEKIGMLLHQKTGLYYRVAVPTSYAAVVTALESDQCDVAWLATFAYLLAKSRADAQIGLMTVRNGMKTYQGQFVSKKSSGIKSLADINGKVIAYTDAASTSGYVYPSIMLKQQNIKPSKEFFAGGHVQALIAVYEGNAEVGCSFFSPPKDGEPQDARKFMKETYPDVFDVIDAFAYTDSIPNDTVTFRKNLPPGMQQKIVDALIDIAHTEEGAKALKNLFDIDDLVPASDSDYDIVRKRLADLNLNYEEFIR